MTRDRTDWPLVAMLFVAGLLAAAQFSKVSLSLAELGRAYERAPESLAHLVSIVGLVGIAFGVVAGSFVAALGARRVLLGCLVLGGALSLAEAALPAIGWMTALRVAEGASHLGLVIAGPTLMAGAAGDRDRPVAMAIWATFFGVSFGLTALLLPPVLSAGGLRLMFVLHGVGLLAIAAILAPMLPRQRRAALHFDPVRMHRAIYGTAHLGAPGLGFVFYTLMFVALITFVPGLLGRPGLAASLPILSLAGTFGAGWIARRIAPDLVMAAGFAGTALLALALWSGIDAAIWPLFAAMGLVPGGAFALIPYLNATASDRALATGGIAQMGNAGTTFGTPFFALLLSLGGFPAACAGLAALAVAGLATVLLLRRATQRTRSRLA
ncbi:major facilitator superfamily protein [Oceaniovalibus guishaninsula JLT2003]|uniref:Major facilitator superfamily protein n=1 Tax=Oceaniovalibus guishaninsula JLT2003 TaxID=1231392 RepID=K2HES2_9RHOB|nr:MFS transporter [Oceaniovalibus guishaninsula]EKE45017.1 major facilitator superfamily protein [Oceaniovalibus guishaninsula JLT2003]